MEHIYIYICSIYLYIYFFYLFKKTYIYLYIFLFIYINIYIYIYIYVYQSTIYSFIYVYIYIYYFPHKDLHSFLIQPARTETPQRTQRRSCDQHRVTSRVVCESMKSVPIWALRNKFAWPFLQNSPVPNWEAMDWSKSNKDEDQCWSCNVHTGRPRAELRDNDKSNWDSDFLLIYCHQGLVGGILCSTDYPSPLLPSLSFPLLIDYKHLKKLYLTRPWCKCWLGNTEVYKRRCQYCPGEH